MGDFAKMSKTDYRIKRQPITTRNPQVNAIIERVHQTIGNILRAFDVNEVDEDDLWSGILAATSFAVQATYHTTLQATPAQLVFGQDAILNIKQVSDWTHISQRKQEIFRKNNRKENLKRKAHDYAFDDLILIKANPNKPKFSAEWEGPYPITALHYTRNGAIRYRNGPKEDSVNIRHIHPYRASIAQG
jgi:hypothetical protein